MATKKDFTKLINSNPTLNFLSNPTDNGVSEQPAPYTEQIKTAQSNDILPDNLHLLNENKTKRLNLVIQPTIYKLAQKKAKETGTSTNNFIINAIIDALQEDTAQ